MSITPFNVYLWQMADEVRSTCGGVVFASVLLAILGVVFLFLSNDKGVDKELKPVFSSISKWSLLFSLPAILLLGTLSSVLPSSKTVALMYVLPEIANSEVVKRDVPEIYNLAVEALKEQLKTYVASGTKK